MDDAGYKQEVQWAWGAAAAGLMFALMIWGGGHAMNFVYTWGPQAAILVIMFFVGARPAALAGAALALAGYLVFFKWWVVTYHPYDGLVWLLYLFSMPGGLLAGIAVAVRLNTRDQRPRGMACLSAASAVIAGIVINQLTLHMALSS